MSCLHRVGVFALGIALIGTAETVWAAPADFPDFAAQKQSREANLRSYYEHSKTAAKIYSENEITIDKQQIPQEQQELKFFINEIRVTKSEQLTADEITEAVAFPGAGDMSVEELQQVVHRLNRLYESKGIRTSQAVLPPQTIKDGIVYIRLIEGRYGKLQVEGNKRILDSYVRKRIHVHEGQLTDLTQLQKDMLLYNNTNSCRLRAQLKAGEKAGTSDVVITLEEPENNWSSYFFIDNAGQEDSGLYRAGYVAEARYLSGSDDRLILNPVWTKGSLSGYVAYDMPISNEGTQASVSYSRNRVKLIDGVLEDFDIKAHSNDLSVAVNHPLNVTELAKTDFFTEIHRKWSDTEYIGTKISDNETNTIKTGFNARKYDETGLWFGQLSVTGYQADFKASDREANGAYYRVYLLRRQILPAGQQLFLRATAQLSSFEEMPSSEQFSLGGMATVRGYDEGILSGDKGWVASAEYSFPIGQERSSLRGFIFYDHGVAYNNYATETTRSYLSSTGIGLEYSDACWYGKLALGVPLNDSEKDIERDKTRLHFYLQKSI